MAFDFTQPVFVISVAAELAEMHPQTLRQYDRLGLVTPSRASGRARRYSQMDVEKLRQNQVRALQSRVTELSEELEKEREKSRIFAADPSGDVVSMTNGGHRAPRKVSQSLMLYRPVKVRGRRK